MEFFENIVECLGEGIVAVNSSLEIIAFNQFAEVITGVPRSQTLNQPLGEVFKENPWLFNAVEKAIKEGFTLSDFERTFTNKELKDIPVGIIVSPLISMEGKIIGGVIVIKDLSAHNPLKDNLLRGDRLAFIGTFAAGIAHEIKNPLGGMRGAMQILSGKLKDRSMLEYTDLVIREVDRVDRLLKKILSFSGPRKIAFRPLNLHEVIDHVLLLQNENAKNKGIYFLKSYDPSIPPIIGDKDGLIQVFLNIIKNGLEAMDRGGKITISTRVLPDFLFVEPQDRPKKIVAVEIEDEGQGIAPEDMSKIFTPFYSTTEGGTGLGLSMTQNIVKEHHGLVKIKSAPGKGTKVSVLIPLTKDSTHNRRPVRI